MNAWITVLRPVSDRIGHHLLAGCDWECFNNMVIWELYSSRASRGTSKLRVDLTVRADAPPCPSWKFMSAVKGFIYFCKHQSGCHVPAFLCHGSFFKGSFNGGQCAAPHNKIYNSLSMEAFPQE